MTESPPPTKGIQIGRLLGARVVLQPSTLIVIGALALFFASSGGAVTSKTFALGVVLAVLLFVSVFLHEVAHAIAARGFRRQVREIVITFWGAHTSFDSAGITPVVNAVTAIVGPLMNVILAVLALFASASGIFPESITAVLSWLGGANLFLAVFNALPGIPMDGGRVLESIVWGASGNRHKGTVVAAWGGRVVAVGVVVYAVAAPLARGGALDVFNLVFALLIASVLWPAASAALKYSQVMGRREGLTVAKVMVSAVAVPYELSVAQARELALAANAREVVVLSADGTPAGHFPVALTDEVPDDARATTSLQAVTMPLPRGAEVPSTLTGEDLVRTLREWWRKTDVWAVRDGENGIVGVVQLSNVLEALK
jgi:Zn-dependent protease